ncbi:hypothetical protein [Komagataeibacter saccharivorans]|uniref:hypothetical protein n=1 Tax=Komagataeibacter saccharivorans TaxID=265959 RepID=UPI0024A86EBA|nr:hypothetical protein [Komagataeibacter saccharivorans]
MLYEFRLSEIVPQMSGATIECIYAAIGDRLPMGAKLLDLSVDLSSAFAQECPPVSYYRLVLREAVFLRRFDAVPGKHYALGEQVALFSTDATETLNGPIGRPIRCTVAGIIHHEAMWSGGCVA